MGDPCTIFYMRWLFCRYFAIYNLLESVRQERKHGSGFMEHVSLLWFTSSLFSASMVRIMLCCVCPFLLLPQLTSMMMMMMIYQYDSTYMYMQARQCSFSWSCAAPTGSSFSNNWLDWINLFELRKYLWETAWELMKITYNNSLVVFSLSK